MTRGFSFISTGRSGSSGFLSIMSIEAGKVNTPQKQTEAEGQNQLDTPQRAFELGEPIPVVFGRRRNGKGGILISPGATEARFENSIYNDVTAYYHLVISEGQVDSIPVKDVFQRSCRVGSHTQTYNRRAGTWTPGNFIVARTGYDMPECPYYCGSVGRYTGLSTLSFSVTIPNGFDQWNRQVHLFIRGGMRVTRIYDSIVGPSDNFADLVKWMLVNSGRVPATLIDNAALTTAATFLEVNGFTCNINIQQSQNYADMLTKMSPHFLLGQTNRGGKKGLRPLLPINANGTINTSAIFPSYTFTDDHVMPGSFEIQYVSLADRQPFVVQVIWRQQLEDDFGLMRTTEVKYDGRAEEGPYESHDLSAYCTSEQHAVKIGAYILAKRVYTSHTIRFVARPEAHNSTVEPGDIVRVRLTRKAAGFALAEHDFFYQVEQVGKTLSGDVSYECVHFPVNAENKSLIALDVAAATAKGVLLTSNKTGVGCDLNSSSNNTIPPEQFLLPDPTDEEILDSSQPDPLSPQDENPVVPVPQPEWPNGYPRPGTDEWPSELPTNTDPSNGQPYVEPIPGTPDNGQSGFVTRVTYSYRYERYESPFIGQCSRNGTVNTPSGSVIAASWGLNTGVKGAFKVFGPAGDCGGSRSFAVYLVRNSTTITTVGLVIGNNDPGYDFMQLGVSITSEPYP